MASKFRTLFSSYNFASSTTTASSSNSTKLPAKVPLQSPLQSQHNFHYGVKISADHAKQLKEDYGLKVEHFTDVAAMAAEEFDDKKSRAEDFGGDSHCRGKASQRITLCNWELKDLTCGQVQYACVDAYYSYKLGKLLIFDNNHGM